MTEHSFVEALDSAILGRTLFLIAHRLSTAKKVDRILVLNEKRLVSSGTHKELMKECEYYRSLVSNQQILSPA